MWLTIPRNPSGNLINNGLVKCSEFFFSKADQLGISGYVRAKILNEWSTMRIEINTVQVKEYQYRLPKVKIKIDFY